jgi:hypothetical protein
MKAISIKQPWASLIVEGIKPVENRSRPWKHRGPLAIHAPKAFDHYAFDLFFSRFPPTRNLGVDDCVKDIIQKSRELTGGIIGSVNMVDCVTSHDSELFFGPYGYVFEDPKRCDLIPWTGRQGVMNVDLGNIPFGHEFLSPFKGHCDCWGCGNLLEKQPKNLECPICKAILLPF